MSDTYVPSTIESFPTELWCEIFKFFDAIELYRTFDKLNSRITSMLSESTPLYFKIATTGHYDFSSYMILPIVNNRANVRSFKFYQEFQIEEFFTLWPINTFTQLWCLSLVYLRVLMSDCSILLIDQLSTLSNFEYLHIQVGCIANYDQCLKRLLQLMFVDNDAFPSLKHFVFQCDANSRMLSLPVTTKHTKLEFLTLPSLCRDKFVQLLSCIPHIKSLKTNWLYTAFNSAAISLSNSDLPNCVDLNLQLDEQWTFEDIECLLQQVSNVKQLKLTCNYFLINGNKWGLLLAENCSKLRLFELVFADCNIDILSPLSELQSSFSTRYWIQQNAQFECNDSTRHLTVRFKI
jgi:hypothetical protein